MCRKGFSLVETAVTIAVVMLLIGAVVAYERGFISGAKVDVVMSFLKDASKAVNSYYADYGNYPSSWSSLTGKYLLSGTVLPYTLKGGAVVESYSSSAGVICNGGLESQPAVTIDFKTGSYADTAEEEIQKRFCYRRIGNKITVGLK